MLSAQLVKNGVVDKTFDLPRLKERGKSAEEIRSQTWRCKFCGEPMTPKLGPIRIWHFGHQQHASACPFSTESEHESEHHRLLKRTSAEALMRHFGELAGTLEYEVRVPEASRIADAMITLKDGGRVAVEAQLSAISLEDLQQRTYAYLDAEIEVIWVFLEERLNTQGPWTVLRQWLLDEGCLVLSARSQVHEKTLALTP